MRKIIQMRDRIAICDDGTAWIYMGNPDEPWRFAGPIPTESIEELTAKRKAAFERRDAMQRSLYEESQRRVVSVKPSSWWRC